MDKVRVIKIFEDTQVNLNLNEQEKKDFLLIRDIIGEMNLSLQVDGKLLVSHYVGFIHVNKTRVLIYPKIARKVKDDNLFNNAFDILVRMLAYTGFDKVKRINTPQNSEIYDGDVLELLIGMFVDELLALFKRDINRSYRSTLENESFIKGKIDFIENTKKNSYRKHLHALRYEQFTENVLMNQIFKTVVLSLVRKTVVRDNRVKLGQALLWLEDVEQIKITDDIWNQVAFTRLNNQYNTVFNMAKLFYYNSSINLNKGNENTLCFLVPLNDLFEKYVFKILKDTAESDAIFLPQGPIRYLGRLSGTNVFGLKPDISMMKNDQVLMIFDAKYKEIIDDKSVSQSDIYQMLAYSVRFNCNQVVLVYPKMIECDKDDFELFHIEIPKESSVLVIRIIQINLECDIDFTINQFSQYLRFLKSKNDTDECKTEAM